MKYGFSKYVIEILVIMTLQLLRNVMKLGQKALLEVQNTRRVANMHTKHKSMNSLNECDQLSYNIYDNI